MYIHRQGRGKGKWEKGNLEARKRKRIVSCEGERDPRAVPGGNKLQLGLYERRNEVTFNEKSKVKH